MRRLRMCANMFESSKKKSVEGGFTVEESWRNRWYPISILTIGKSKPSKEVIHSACPGGRSQCTEDMTKARNLVAKMTVELARRTAALIRQAKENLETASEYKLLMEEMSAPADQLVVMDCIGKRMQQAFDALDEAETKLTI